MKRWSIVLFLIFAFGFSSLSYAADSGSELKDPQDTAKNDEKLADEPQEQKATGLFGSSALMNPNISLVLNVFGYASNLSKQELELSGIPGYTNIGLDYKKGFNLDSAELYLYAPVDPYFNLYTTIPVTESGAEVEEAYFVTTFLPYGLQIKGGKFKSSFGRINSQHSHVWDFADIPLVYEAFTGKEGIDEIGAQITYLPSLPFYLLLGAEVLQGENEVLFGANAKAGPHAYTFFAKVSLDLTDNSTVVFGPSAMTGNTDTTSIADNTEFRGTSTLGGFEFTYKWKPSRKKSLTVQSEYLIRGQSGQLENTDTLTSEPLKRIQDGLYIQSVYQMGRWRLGGRYDALELLKSDYILLGTNQNFGKKPWRASAMIDFSPTEFSRIRLQYNYGRSAPGGKTNQEFFLQVILGIGAHAAHPF